MRRLSITLLALSAGTAASAQGFTNSSQRPHGAFFGNAPPAQHASPGFASPSYALPRQPNAYPAYKAPRISSPSAGDEVQRFKPYQPWKGNSVYGDKPYSPYRPKYGSTYGN